MHTTCHVEEVERMHHDKCVWAVSTILKGGVKKRIEDDLQWKVAISASTMLLPPYLFIYFLSCFIALYTRSNHPSTEFCQRLSISFQIISKNWYYKFCVSLRGIPFSSYSSEKNIPRIL